MKLKLMPVLAGAIALAAAVVPDSVAAQTSQPQQPAPNQAQTRPQLAGVEITPQQQDQLNKLRSDTRTQIESILTPQQREEFKTAMRTNQNPQTAFSNLKLSNQQQTQLQGIMQSARARAEAILTPEQRQQIQKNMEQNAPKGGSQ